MEKRLIYSTDLEEVAYSKDPKALREAASRVLSSESLVDGKRDETFFNLGQTLPNSWATVFYFVLWEDQETVLVFQGFIKDILKKVRSLPERTMAEQS